MLASELIVEGHSARVKPKYLEIDVESYDELIFCLKLFIHKLPVYQQIELAS